MQSILSLQRKQYCIKYSNGEMYILCLTYDAKIYLANTCYSNVGIYIQIINNLDFTKKLNNTTKQNKLSKTCITFIFITF